MYFLNPDIKCIRCRARRLSPQGTESEIFLSAKDGIEDPIDICFNSQDYKSLCLSNESGKSI